MSARRRACGGFGGFEEFISEQGGIVTRAELLEAGWTADELRIAQGTYRRPTRLRRGWYCSAEVPERIRRSWAHGGALACWSALEWHAARGSARARAALRVRAEHVARTAGEPVDTSLHICLPPNAHVRVVEADDPSAVKRHWHPAALRPSARWAMPVDVAIEQTRRCAA